ncbi:MAG: hypothetical protein QM499_04015 [Flavobacteriaceae bacterium]
MSKNKLLYGSVFILLYLITLQLIYFFKIDYVFIGVIVELITIPVLIAIPILLFLSLKNWKKESWNKCSSNMFSSITLVISILIILLSS